MKRTTVQKIITALFIALVIITIAMPTFATLNPLNVQPRPGVASEKVFNVAGTVLGIAQAIGVSVAVIILVVIAIKYITASAEGKSEVKKYATGYILGAVLLFAGVAILNIIQQFAVTI